MATDRLSPDADWRILRELQGHDPGAISSLCTDDVNGTDDPAWHVDCIGCGCYCHSEESGDG